MKYALFNLFCYFGSEKHPLGIYALQIFFYLVSVLFTVAYQSRYLYFAGMSNLCSFAWQQNSIKIVTY